MTLPVVCAQHGIIGLAADADEANVLLMRHGWTPAHTTAQGLHDRDKRLEALVWEEDADAVTEP